MCGKALTGLLKFDLFASITLILLKVSKVAFVDWDL